MAEQLTLCGLQHPKNQQLPPATGNKPQRAWLNPTAGCNAMLRDSSYPAGCPGRRSKPYRCCLERGIDENTARVCCYCFKRQETGIMSQPQHCSFKGLKAFYKTHFTSLTCFFLSLRKITTENERLYLSPHRNNMSLLGQNLALKIIVGCLAQGSP